MNTNSNLAFGQFPIEESYYAPDVRTIMGETIAKYGIEEWIAGVMTCEIHRHLGIYAIIGMKMGIRAKEHFDVGVGKLQVVSYSGTKPPFSCMNDGLQISTGATLGHGLINISPNHDKIIGAAFNYQNETITLILEENLATKIRSEIKTLRDQYGLKNPLYWEEVRQMAIDFWSEYDRAEIFEVS
ncbi:MAG: formylmethanofuran dehydrogenase subunit E family protein [Bacteroidales bacterium]|nr:formylmethanofuran dehydrogenase subunit E family protein [Bacteroidales bacterium]